MRCLLEAQVWVRLGVVTVLWAIAVPAHASPIFWSRAFGLASANIFGATETADTGQLDSSATAGPVTATLTDGSGASGSATASVADGALHAFATSTGVVLDANTLVGGAGTALAQFEDTLTLTSSTLDPGTLVTLLFGIDLHYSLTGDSGGCAGGIGNTASVTANVFLGGNLATLTDSTCDASDSQTLTGTVQAAIGDELLLYAELYALASAQSATATADAGSTLNMFIAPQGDFGFTTASSNIYETEPSTAAPEPGSLTLLGVGLVSYAIRRRRRRNVHGSLDAGNERCLA